MNKEEFLTDQDFTDIAHRNATNEQWQQEEESIRQLHEGEYPYEEQSQQQPEPTEAEWEDLEKQSLSALNQFQKGLTKVDIKEMAGNVIENLLINGNPLQIAEALSAMENFIKEVKDDPRYKNYVREEIGKYPKGFTSKSGAKIELAETGTSYDFDKCNDPELERVESVLESVKERLDKRKSFLKTVPATGLVVTNEETGETWKCYPPSKTSNSSYKITLSKGF